MRFRFPRLAMLALLAGSPLYSQQRQGLSPAVADTGIFSPVPLAEPNLVRRQSGAPGRDYWQQRADYSIAATLDTAAKILKGSVTIRYTNNSPDTLRSLWLQMDQNLFRPGSTGSLLNAASSRFGGAGFEGGYLVESIYQTAAATPRPGANRQGTAAAQLPVTTRVDETMMEIDLATPLAPGKATAIQIAYHFNIPEHGADRMGREGTLYEMAQWFPRMAVYDDVEGWNTDQYLGQGEFYLDYGNYDYQITLPAGYIVAATGTLQNPLEVLTADQRTRLARAARSDSTIHVITEQELTSGTARPRSTGTLTWKFKAENVRDVAWAASPGYLWDASSWEGILAHAYFRPAAKTNWSDVARQTRFSIQEYSTRWFRYPYPQMSAIEGLVSGMEYPMVAMESNTETLADLYSVVTHEIGHSWFPMIVGSNERRFAWMDEGFNTFINTFSEAGYFKRDDSAVRKGEISFVLQNDQAPTAQPMITPANRYKGNANLGSLAYIKPSIMLLTLRNQVLDSTVFDRAMREYVQRWAFKHPYPADFMRTIEDVSGRDLAWFWRGWIFTTAALDLGIESVTQRVQGGGNVARVTLRNQGQQVMPVRLSLTLGDGSTREVKLPVEVWYGGDRYVAVIPTAAAVAAATIDGDGLLPDVNPANNSWKAQ